MLAYFKISLILCLLMLLLFLVQFLAQLIVDGVQMQLKVKEEYNNYLKGEVAALTKKIEQKFELLDVKQEVPNLE